MMHDLKLHSKWFYPVALGAKTFEIRKNDRNFKPGDILILNEIEDIPGGSEDYDTQYTGSQITALVTHVLTSKDFPDGLKDGYAILSIVVKKVIWEGCE